ncbi:MAG: hypothetical protein HQK53_07565 [Oligoflexia bacterium]|nr:hypothetical protein [Oligoflexia bacterium]
MQIMRDIIVLAGGVGQRLQGLTPYKALTPLGRGKGQDNQVLVKRLIEQLLSLDGGRNGSLLLAANSLLQGKVEEHLQGFENVEIIYLNTPSSLHTFYHSMKHILRDCDLPRPPHQGAPHQGAPHHILVSMVDSIVKDDDLKKFICFCDSLAPGESALLTTTHVDDEKPLRVWSRADYMPGVAAMPVDYIGDPPAESDFGDRAVITAGVYCFSANIFPLLLECIDEGMEKMRNFLAQMVEKNYPVYAFTVEKTIDLDRPEDWGQALDFLSFLS